MKACKLLHHGVGLLSAGSAMKRTSVISPSTSCRAQHCTTAKRGIAVPERNIRAQWTCFVLLVVPHVPTRFGVPQESGHRNRSAYIDPIRAAPGTATQTSVLSSLSQRQQPLPTSRVRAV